MPARKNKLLASKIPPITALREELDYGDAKLGRCVTFYDDVRAFRKKYHTSAGCPGANLHNWKSAEHQAGLDEMTIAYLDSHGNGVHYWPDDDASALRNKLQYSKDHERIKDVMKQLFFRLNQQQYRNVKYKRKGRLSSEAHDSPGSSPALPIEINESEVGEDRSTVGKDPSLPPSSKTPHNPVQCTDDSLAESVRKSKARTARSHAPPLQEGEDDPLQPGEIYEIPVNPQRPSMSGSPTPPRNVLSIPPVSRNRSVTAKLQSSLPNAPTVSWRRKHSLDDENEASKERPQKVVRLAYKTRSNSGLENSAAARISSPIATQMSPVDSTVENFSEHATQRQSRESSYPQSSIESIEEQRNLGRYQKQQARPEYPVSTGDDVKAISSRIATATCAEDSRAISAPYDANMRTTVATRPHSEGNTEAAPATVIHSSSLRSFSLRSTSSPTSKAEATRHPSTEQKPSVGQPETANKTRSPVEFRYCVTVSHGSTYVSKRWRPKGRFQEKSLHELLTELPVEGGAVKALNITLEGPDTRVEDQIDSHDEAGFEYLKKRINKRIRAFLERRKETSAPLVFEMEIEPIREGDDGADSKGEGSGDDLIW